MDKVRRDLPSTRLHAQHFASRRICGRGKRRQKKRLKGARLL